MTTNRDKIVDKIKKLMALANGGSSFEAEMNSALAFARQIMDQHNIDEQEILLNESVEDLVGEIVEDEMINRKSVRRYAINLIWAACYLTDCRWYRSKIPSYNNGKYQSRISIKLYGRKDDIRTCTDIYQELNVIMRAMARAHCGSGWGASHRSYSIGFSITVQQRAHDLKQSSEQNETCTALVLKKDAVLNRFEENLGLVVKKGRKTSVSDWGAYCRGSEDGKNVSLSTNQKVNGIANKQLR